MSTKVRSSIIIKERASSALKSQSWNEGLIKQIAELSHGDARTAIQTLKSAALNVQESGSKSIKKEHIESTISEMKDLKKEYAIRKLSEDLKLLYEIIKRHGIIVSGKLWKDYIKECSKRNQRPVARRTFTHYMDKLKQMQLIKVKRARVKGRVHAYSLVD